MTKLLEHKRTLITGGAGFIGQHLAQKFSENENEITIFDTQKPVTDRGVVYR